MKLKYLTFIFFVFLIIVGCENKKSEDNSWLKN